MFVICILNINIGMIREVKKLLLFKVFCLKNCLIVYFKKYREGMFCSLFYNIYVYFCFSIVILDSFLSFEVWIVFRKCKIFVGLGSVGIC